MKKLTIVEIEKRLFENRETDNSFIHSLKKDERKGVQRMVNKWMRLREKEKNLHEKFLKMTLFERRLWSQGYEYVVGIDEVGRGPLAGPVVAGAVILPKDFYLPGIDDSKKLTERKREDFFEKIKSEALGIGIGMIETEEIDRINILEASKKAMYAALLQLPVVPDYLLVDAVELETPYPSEALIKGDERSVSIAAASIIAKVTRDRLMQEISSIHPEYGFDSNMGYGTAGHLKAIEQYGITAYHRKSFAPIRLYDIQGK